MGRPQTAAGLTPAEAARQGTPPNQRGEVQLEHADTVSTPPGDEDTVILSGNVRITYNGYTVTADRATYNRAKKELTFESNVRMEAGDQVVYAEKVTVEVATNEFVTRDGRTVLPPEKVGPQIVQPLRISGTTLERIGRNFRATGGFLTTCDFPRPHYKIGFRQADVLLNDRLVLRDAVFYRYEKPIFRLKYLVIPIREGTPPRYLPYAGRSEEEGYFVKLVLGYSLARTLPGLLHLDFMQKKGIGIGFDQAYQVGDRAAGTVNLYTLNDRNRGVHNTNGLITHQQLIGDFLATINTNFQNNSYQALTTNSHTGLTTITLARSGSGRTTNLSLSQNTSDYGTSNTKTTNYTLTQTERLGGSRGSITFRLNGSDTTNASTFNDTTTTSGRTEQTGDIQARGKLRLFDIDFDATGQANKALVERQKGQSGGTAFSGTQRLPELNLSADAKQFGGLFKYLPTTFQFGFGRYLEAITGFTGGTTSTHEVTTNRLLFNAALNPRPVELAKRGWLTLNSSGSFRQTYYRSDAAQYVLNGQFGLTQKLRKDSNFTIGYTYLEAYGGTPQDFHLDQTGSNNNLTSNLTLSSYRTRFTLSTGYDIQRAWTDTSPGIKRNPWQNAAIGLAFRPSDMMQTRFTASYDINSGRLLDLNNRLRLRGRFGSALDTGTRYDPSRHKIATITEVATIPLFSRDVKLYALTGYNGLTYKFDYKQFTLVHSFHDYDLVFAYVDQPFGFRRETGFNFSIRLRAFPAALSTPGSQFGTPLDTGTGEVF